MAEVDFKEVFVSTVKDAGTEYVKETLTDALSELPLTAIVRSVIAEGVSTLAGSLVGPILRTVLHMVDTSNAKLNKLIRAPLKAGEAEARRAFAVVPITDGDRLLQKRYYDMALSNFEQAYVISSSATQRRKIRFYQALIARAMDAPAYTKSFLEQYDSYCLVELPIAYAQLREAQAQLDQFLLNPEAATREANARQRKWVAEYKPRDKVWYYRGEVMRVERDIPPVYREASALNVQASYESALHESSGYFDRTLAFSEFFGLPDNRNYFATLTAEEAREQTLDQYREHLALTRSTH
jgi:hypothetical protein